MMPRPPAGYDAAPTFRQLVELTVIAIAAWVISLVLALLEVERRRRRALRLERVIREAEADASREAIRQAASKQGPFTADPIRRTALGRQRQNPGE